MEITVPYDLAFSTGLRYSDFAQTVVRPERRAGWEVSAEYFTKYPGRFISMHVQGWSAETKRSCRSGRDPWTGRGSSARPKPEGSRTTLLR